MNDETIIHSVSFRQDGLVELTYSEAVDQSADIQVMKMMLVDPKHAGPQIAEVVSDLQELIYLAMVRLRNDPATLPG